MEQPKRYTSYPGEDTEIVIYETAREIAVKVLNRVERTDSYLDKVLDFELKNSELSRLDKSFLTELVNGTIRWKARIDYVIMQFYRGDYSKLDINIKNAIRIAMYQIMFLERVPQSAAVNEAVQFVKKLRGQMMANLVNAILRTSLRKIDSLEYPSIEDDAVKALSTVHSFPQWLVRRFMDRFGVYETEQLLVSLNERPKLSVRANPKRVSPAALAASFEQMGLRITGGKFIPNFFYVEGLSRIGELESFRAGEFTVQDESAGVVSVLLDPKPGERILDMCAAPGGKTTHILDITNGDVDLTSVEKYDVRARLVQDSLDRLGYSRVKIVVADASRYSDAVLFDKVLVDAPCTGFGVVRRKPDSKWKREPQDIKLLNRIQSDIIENAAKLLKPNGILVYSTCTIESEENQDVVEEFLERHPEFELEPADAFVDRLLVSKDGYIETFPHRHDMDGSFAARLRKAR